MALNLGSALSGVKPQDPNLQMKARTAPAANSAVAAGVGSGLSIARPAATPTPAASSIASGLGTGYQVQMAPGSLAPAGFSSTAAGGTRPFGSGSLAPASNPFAPKPPPVAQVGSAAPTAAGAVAPRAVDTYTPGALMQTQFNQAAPAMQSAQQLGANLQGQGAQVANQQAQQAANFNAQGQGFNATAQQAAPGFVGAQMPMGGGTRAPAALSTSQLGAAPSIGQIANVAGQLGATPQAAGVGDISGRLGGAPGAVNPAALGAISNVAGALGGGYQVGSVGGIAGRLSAAPQVGDVGSIQMGAGPAAIAGQLGNMGATNADQAGMLSRVNQFLDAPEGPSVAEAQLRQAQASNMADLIGAARSGRGGAGAQALALQDAMSAGAGIASDTAGQLATLRAQEADMLKNRQLSAIGLGGQMAEAQRAQDLGFRGQDLTALTADQSTALGARGQDLQSAMANQSTQTALEQLRAQTALGARGQDLSALQGDQGTALGLEGLRANTAVANRGQDLSALTADQQASVAARGQNLGALQGNQQTALGARGQDLSALQGDQATQAQMSLGQLQAAMQGRGQDLSALQGDQSTALGREGLAAQTALTGRGQDLSALQGNQATALGARGQDVTRELGLGNINMGLRGQDASMLMSDADRNLAAQRLGLDAGLGYGSLANQANQTGLNYLSQANQQGLLAQGMSNDLLQSTQSNQTSLQNALTAGQYGLQAAAASQPNTPSFWEQMALNTVGGLSQGAGSALVKASDERAKVEIKPLDSIKSQLDDHLRAAPGYTYKYKPGFGEDPDIERTGPMAQDLERSPFGKDIVIERADGLKMVDTGRLALVNHAALASMRSELDRLKAALEG